jgi:integrase
MAREHGEGSLYWDDERKRWVALASVGYTPEGKRIRKKGTGRTRTEAKRKLREVTRDYEDGLAIAPANFTVKDAVEDWLTFGLGHLDAGTRADYAGQCRNHVITGLGARKLRDLSAEDVDRWLAGLSKRFSTSYVRLLRSHLNRAVRRAMARDKVKRNVVELSDIPAGQLGRPSKSLTLQQASSVLDAADREPLGPYVMTSLLTGARPEELRPLAWTHVDLEGDMSADPPVPPHLAVWRSVRAGGDTKTPKSRRTLALSERCIAALRRQQEVQIRQRREAGPYWQDLGLVFTSSVGTELDASNVRKAFRKVLSGADGIDPAEWSPRELRHSFVSILSDKGVPLEEISRLVGHSSTAVTETVYRKQIRPVIQTGATVMDEVFGKDEAATRQDRKAGPAD